MEQAQTLRWSHSIYRLDNASAQAMQTAAHMNCTQKQNFNYLFTLEAPVHYILITMSFFSKKILCS
jgi:hypothetical protein